MRLNVPVVSSQKRKKMITVGLPGSGLSYRQPIGASAGGSAPWWVYRVIPWVVVALVLWFLFGALAHAQDDNPNFGKADDYGSNRFMTVHTCQ
jgi:hypothetical protein